MAEESLETYVSSTEDKEAVLAYTKVYGAFKVGISNDDSTKYYNQWAGKYDKEVSKQDHYNGPIIAGETLAKHYTKDRGAISILDIAAGTGYVGEELKRHGFKLVDALDPSEGMLSVAKSKSIYRKYICSFLDEGNTPVKDNEYDCCVVSGGMGEGHIPCTGLIEMIRIVKPGGLVCIVLREEFLYYVDEYKDNLEPFMDKLEKAGKWKKISRDVVDNYTFNKNGIVYKYKVC